MNVSITRRLFAVFCILSILCICSSFAQRSSRSQEETAPSIVLRPSRGTAKFGSPSEQSWESAKVASDDENKRPRNRSQDSYEPEPAFSVASPVTHQLISSRNVHSDRRRSPQNSDDTSESLSPRSKPSQFGRSISDSEVISESSRTKNGRHTERTDTAQRFTSRRRSPDSQRESSIKDDEGRRQFSTETPELSSSEASRSRGRSRSSSFSSALNVAAESRRRSPAEKNSGSERQVSSRRGQTVRNEESGANGRLRNGRRNVPKSEDSQKNTTPSPSLEATVKAIDELPVTSTETISAAKKEMREYIPVEEVVDETPYTVQESAKSDQVSVTKSPEDLPEINDSEEPKAVKQDSDRKSPVLNDRRKKVASRRGASFKSDTDKDQNVESTTSSIPSRRKSLRDESDPPLRQRQTSARNWRHAQTSSRQDGINEDKVKLSNQDEITESSSESNKREQRRTEYTSNLSPPFKRTSTTVAPELVFDNNSSDQRSQRKFNTRSRQENNSRFRSFKNPETSDTENDTAYDSRKHRADSGTVTVNSKDSDVEINKPVEPKLNTPLSLFPRRPSTRNKSDLVLGRKPVVEAATPSNQDEISATPQRSNVRSGRVTPHTPEGQKYTGRSSFRSRDRILPDQEEYITGIVSGQKSDFPTEDSLDSEENQKSSSSDDTFITRSSHQVVTVTVLPDSFLSQQDNRENNVLDSIVSTPRTTGLRNKYRATYNIEQKIASGKTRPRAYQKSTPGAKQKDAVDEQITSTTESSSRSSESSTRFRPIPLRGARPPPFSSLIKRSYTTVAADTSTEFSNEVPGAIQLPPRPKFEFRPSSLSARSVTPPTTNGIPNNLFTNREGVPRFSARYRSDLFKTSSFRSTSTSTPVYIPTVPTVRASSPFTTSSVSPQVKPVSSSIGDNDIPLLKTPVHYNAILARSVDKMMRDDISVILPSDIVMPQEAVNTLSFMLPDITTQQSVTLIEATTTPSTESEMMTTNTPALIETTSATSTSTTTTTQIPTTITLTTDPSTTSTTTAETADSNALSSTTSTSTETSEVSLSNLIITEQPTTTPTSNMPELTEIITVVPTVIPRIAEIPTTNEELTTSIPLTTPGSESPSNSTVRAIALSVPASTTSDANVISSVPTTELSNEILPLNDSTSSSESTIISTITPDSQTTMAYSGRFAMRLTIAPKGTMSSTTPSQPEIRNQLSESGLQMMQRRIDSVAQESAMVSLSTAVSSSDPYLNSQNSVRQFYDSRNEVDSPLIHPHFQDALPPCNRPFYSPIFASNQASINFPSFDDSLGIRRTILPRTPVPYVIFGIYPNNTVFRKFPDSDYKEIVDENEIARREPYYPEEQFRNRNFFRTRIFPDTAQVPYFERNQGFSPSPRTVATSTLDSNSNFNTVTDKRSEDLPSQNLVMSSESATTNVPVIPLRIGEDALSSSTSSSSSPSSSSTSKTSVFIVTPEMMRTEGTATTEKSETISEVQETPASTASMTTQSASTPAESTTASTTTTTTTTTEMPTTTTQTTSTTTTTTTEMPTTTTQSSTTTETTTTSTTTTTTTQKPTTTSTTKKPATTTKKSSTTKKLITSATTRKATTSAKELEIVTPTLVKSSPSISNTSPSTESLFDDLALLSDLLQNQTNGDAARPNRDQATDGLANRIIEMALQRGTTPRISKESLKTTALPPTPALKDAENQLLRLLGQPDTKFLESASVSVSAVTSPTPFNQDSDSDSRAILSLLQNAGRSRDLSSSSSQQGTSNRQLFDQLNIQDIIGLATQIQNAQNSQKGGAGTSDPGGLRILLHGLAPHVPTTTAPKPKKAGSQKSGRPRSQQASKDNGNNSTGSAQALVDTAVNVTKMVSQIMGNLIQGAAHSFQTFVQNRAGRFAQYFHFGGSNDTKTS